MNKRTISKVIFAVAIFLAITFVLTACGGSLELKQFAVDRSTIKTSYFLGEEIDFSGIRASVTYTDKGLDRVLTFDDLTISYPDDITDTEGTKTVEVSFYDENLQVTQKLNITITVQRDPSIPVHYAYVLNSDDMKKSYILGEEIDFSGLRLYDQLSDGSESAITDLSDLEFSFDEDITDTVGTKEIECSFRGEAVEGINITVRYPSVKSITIDTTDAITEYDEGDTLSLAGLVATVTYEDDSTRTVDSGFSSITPIDTIGAKDVMVTFTDPISGEFLDGEYGIRIDGIVEYILNTAATKKEYFVDDTLDFSATVVTADYYYRADETVPLSEVTFVHADNLTATAGQSKEVIVKVGETEVGRFNVAVGDVIATPVVNDTGVDLSYRVGETVDLTGLTVGVTYNDGTPADTVALSELTVVYPDGITSAGVTESAGKKQITLSYNDEVVNDTVTVYVTVTVYGIDGYEIDATAMRTTYVVGQTPVTTGIKVYEHYLDGGADVEITDYTAVTIENVTGTVSSSKIAKVYLNGVEIGTVTLVVEKNTIVSVTVGGTYKNTYETEDTLDFSGLTLTILYKDNTEIVVHTGISYSATTAQATPGKQNVTASCPDTVNVGETASKGFQIDVVERKLQVMGFEKPSEIVAFETDKNNAGKAYGTTGFESSFANTQEYYIVGDDNPFKFLPKLSVMDGTTKVLTQYYSVVNLSVGGNELTAVKNGNTVTYSQDSDEIATVNTYTGSYQFTANAVDKVVTISVLPSADYYVVDGFNALTLTVKVIDAYNIYEAKELAVVDNSGRQVWRNFKTLNGLDGINPNGIVLHGDIAITAEDVGEDFFYTTTSEVTYYKESSSGEVYKTVPVGSKYLKDYMIVDGTSDTEENTAIYRRMGADGFTIQGNLFSIDVRNFPIVASPEVFGVDANKDYRADFSNATLFYFTSFESYAFVPQGNTFGSRASFSINNVHLQGNASRDKIVDAGGNLVSAGGLIFEKTAEGADMVIENTIGNSFFISYFTDWFGWMELNDVKCYDSYQNAIFAYADTDTIVNDCYFVGAGGPIVILQSNESKNAQGVYVRYNPEFTSNNSVMSSALTGQEIWFTAVNATSMVSSIKALGAGMAQAGLGNLSDSQGNMNIVGLLMESGSDATAVVGGLGAQGSVYFDGNGITRYTTNATWEGIYNMSAYINTNTASWAPFFTVTYGGTDYTMFYNGATFCNMTGAELGAADAALINAFQNSEYVVLTQGGLSIVFELYH